MNVEEPQADHPGQPVDEGSQVNPAETAPSVIDVEIDAAREEFNPFLADDGGWTRDDEAAYRAALAIPEPCVQVDTAAQANLRLRLEIAQAARDQAHWLGLPGALEADELVQRLEAELGSDETPYMGSVRARERGRQEERRNVWLAEQAARRAEQSAREARLAELASKRAAREARMAVVGSSAAIRAQLLAAVPKRTGGAGESSRPGPSPLGRSPADAEPQESTAEAAKEPLTVRAQGEWLRVPIPAHG